MHNDYAWFSFVKVATSAQIDTETKYLHTWDSIATLLLTRSVVVIATAAESALHTHW